MLGTVIKTTREIRNIQASELCRKTGLQRRTLWQIENDSINPKWSSMKSLLLALDVDIEAFITKQLLQPGDKEQ